MHPPQTSPPCYILLSPFANDVFANPLFHFSLCGFPYGLDFLLHRMISDRLVDEPDAPIPGLHDFMVQVVLSQVDERSLCKSCICEIGWSVPLLTMYMKVCCRVL